MNIIFDVTLGDIIGYIITIIGFGFVGFRISNKNNRLVSKVLYKSIYSFKEVRIMLIYS